MRKRLLWMMVVLLAAGFTACSEDEVLDGFTVESATDAAPFQWTR